MLPLPSALPDKLGRDEDLERTVVLKTSFKASLKVFPVLPTAIAMRPWWPRTCARCWRAWATSAKTRWT
eukprot:g10135.t1